MFFREIFSGSQRKTLDPGLRRDDD